MILSSPIRATGIIVFSSVDWIIQEERREEDAKICGTLFTLCAE